MMSGSMPRRFRVRSTPMWDHPRATPAPSARPMRGRVRARLESSGIQGPAQMLWRTTDDGHTTEINLIHGSPILRARKSLDCEGVHPMTAEYPMGQVTTGLIARDGSSSGNAL